MWPSVLKLRCDRPADIFGQGQLDQPAPFAVDAQGTVLPVDIIQFEKHHFAGTQTQPRKQQQNRIVASSDRGASIDSCQQSADLIRCNRPRNRRHRPVRHNGYGRSQIQPDITAIRRALEEQTQCSGQELGCLQMQSWRLALNKPHHVSSTQLREPDRCAAKAILEELANKPHIVDDRRRRQNAFLAQIPLICADVLFDRARSTLAYLLDGDDITITQKIEELLQRRSVTLANLLPPRTISKGLVEMPRWDAVPTDS